MFKTQNFPQLKAMKEKGITYLDSAATTLKLDSCVEEQYKFNLTGVSNVHRGAHQLASAATVGFEETRTAVSSFFNSPSSENIVFTKGTTESINLVAHHFEKTLQQNDCVLITEMEHHANLVPWQRVCKESGAKLLYVPVLESGELDLEEAERLLKTNPVKIFSFVHVSNTLGTLNPVKKLIEIAKKNGALTLIDGAQAVSAIKVDFQELDPDFYTFSAHKLFGPFGLGVLYMKNPKSTLPYQVGGAMIEEVQFHDSTFLKSPQKFEAGTPNIDAIVSFKKAIDYCNELNLNEVKNSEVELLNQARQGLKEIKGFKEFGVSDTKFNILSFNVEGVHAGDLCELLDEQGLALRSGHHCTQPLLRKFGLSSCARASFSIYNSKEDVETLITGTKKALELLR